MERGSTWLVSESCLSQNGFMVVMVLSLADVAHIIGLRIGCCMDCT